MNLSFKTMNGIFTLRSAALVINDNHILIAKSDNFDCFYTIGGSVWENESSENAVVRELYEETGYHFEVDRLVFIQERFFNAKSTCHQEVVLFYLMKPADIDLPNGINTDLPNEHLYWIPIEKLEQINLVPAFLKTATKNIPDEIKHIVSYE